MKWVLIATLTCNQVIYDQLWLRVLSYKVAENVQVLDAINHHEQLDVQTDPPDFEILRKLCNGQLSTYERHK
jgi:hypothetical protein